MQVYLDYNATTPYAEEVVESVHNAMKSVWGNPSSSHTLGQKAKAVIEESRGKVASMIDSDPKEIIFTSGGTESNNMVIMNAVKCFQKTCQNGYGRSKRPHVISTNIEHDSVRLPLEQLAKEDVIDVTYVPAQKSSGRVSADEILGALRPETCLITVILANNETGIIQPIAEIAKLMTETKRRLSSGSNAHQARPVLFHTDAAQAIGKIPVSVKDLGVDYLTVVGHKFYGPRIGALYARNIHKHSGILNPVFFGGGQERGFRPGTENTAMIAGLGAASELVSLHISDYQSHMVNMRNYLEDLLEKTFTGKIALNNTRGSVPRLPNTTSVAFAIETVTGADILKAAPALIASTAAACHSGRRVSSVLVNSGVSEYLAERTLRLSVGRETRKEDIELAVHHLSKAVDKLCSLK